MKTPKIPSAVQKKAKLLLDSELTLDRLTPLYKEAEKNNKQLRLELNEMLTDLGFSSIKIDGIGRLTTSFMGPYASIEKNGDGSTSEEALAKFRAFCEANGIYDTIFRSSPNMQRVSGLVKEALEGNSEMPPGVTHYLLKGVSLTRDDSVPKKPKR